jgi:hypothetical protein
MRADLLFMDSEANGAVVLARWDSAMIYLDQMVIIRVLETASRQWEITVAVRPWNADLAWDFGVSGRLVGRIRRSLIGS